MNKLIIQFKKVSPLCLTVFTLGCLALLPSAQAVIPAPDGCYPGFTTAEGCSALHSLTTGAGNTGVGWYSLFSNSTGSFNTAVGAGALDLNNADSNTAVGASALLLNTTGTLNTAIGTDALVFNDSGSRHTAVGMGALENCVAPPDFAGNTAVGTQALFNDTTGNFNTAIGDAAMKLNTTGTQNVAIGLDALVFNTAGNSDTAVGTNALFNNTTGGGNTATGIQVLFANTTGSNNTAAGVAALQANITGNSNTTVGFLALSALTSGDGNVALGSQAGSTVLTASNVIAIGHPGADVSNTCFIGNIRGTATQHADAVPVLIDSAGQLGTASSSARFKKDVKSMDKASEAILAFKPVTFHYKTDKTSTAQFGLIAEEVAKVNPNLVVRDKDGEIYTVRYDAVNAMLLNEFLKEHREMQEQKATIARQQKQIDALTAGLQKVSAQLEVIKPAPQTVLNNQ